MLKDILRLYNVDITTITGSIISSVVPPVTRHIVTAIENLTGILPVTVEPGLKTGLNIKIDNPGELGADLVCGAVAVKELYRRAADGTLSPCIGIDMGTVTKVMAIDSSGALLGGVLCPGVGMGFQSMASSTALLPLVGAAKAEKIIGTNTTDCIKGGIIYGTACMLDGLMAFYICRRKRRSTKKRPKCPKARYSKKKAELSRAADYFCATRIY
jgi:type III pantothenate kinase